MTLTADPRWWCWHDRDGWRLDLWEYGPLPDLNDAATPWQRPVPRTFGPYPTQGAALGAAFALGVQLLPADDDGRLP